MLPATHESHGLRPLYSRDDSLNPIRLQVTQPAAASAKNLTHMTASLANTFLDDVDPGVRKWGLRSLELNPPSGIKTKVEKIMKDDPDSVLRELARKVVDRLQ